MVGGSNATTYNPYDLFKLWKNGAKFGSYSPRHLNVSGDFSISEDTVNNLYNLGISASRIVKPLSYLIRIGSDGAVHGINGDTGSIDYSTNSAPATSADTRTLFNNVFSAIQSTGGRVFVKRGTYTIDARVQVGNGFSNLPNSNIVVSGEGMGITTMKFDGTATPALMMQLYCNARVEDMTMDGNGQSQGLIDAETPSYTHINRVHFINNGSGHTNLQSYTQNDGSGAKGMAVTNCWFDQTNTGDQYAIGVAEYSLIDSCFFDKRVAGLGPDGNTLGSCLTSGSGNNIIITNNTFLRAANDEGPAISLEPFGWPYNRIVIAGNTMVNGITIVGGTGNWTTAGNLQSTTYRNVSIVGNTCLGHRISIWGPSIALGGHIQNVVIAGNALQLSVHQDMYHSYVQGPMLITGNVLMDSDTANTQGGGNGLITLDTCNNVDINNNILTMSAGSLTDNVIKYVTVAGMRFHDNNLVVLNGATGTGIINDAGSNSNVKFWDNEGYATNLRGVSTFSGNGSLTAFTVTHGLSVTPTIPIISTNQNIHAYVSAITSTTFTVTFSSAPPTGTVAIYWSAEKTVFA